MERLDKILSNMGKGSRKEVKDYIKKGLVTVDGEKILDEKRKFNPKESTIVFNGEMVNYRKYIYLLMNKPEGYLSATEDDVDPVVVDLLSENHRIFSPYPVGRLDKDTVGLLLLTNNGELNHRLISPKWKVEKKYVANLLNPPMDDYGKKIEEGIVIDDGYKCLPGKYRILDEEKNLVELIISEGKFHQVKRMFEALDNKVIHLERVAFGPINLPTDLERGSYRELEKEEINKLGNITEISDL